MGGTVRKIFISLGGSIYGSNPGFIAVFAYLYCNVLCLLLHVLISRSISLTSIHQRLRCRQSWKLFEHNDHGSLFC